MAYLLYLFICWCTFRLLSCPGIVNNAAMNTGVHASFGIMIFSRYMPRSYNFTFLCLISSPFSSPPSFSLMSIPILYLVLMCQPQVGGWIKLLRGAYRSQLFTTLPALYSPSLHVSATTQALWNNISFPCFMPLNFVLPGLLSLSQTGGSVVIIIIY